MTDRRLVQEIEEGLSEVPILDVHSHLIGGRLGARGLHDILLYHMAVSDLYCAGCPSGNRLTEFPDSPDEQEAEFRIREALPFLPLVRNTSSFWGIRIILAELYGWRQEIDEENWRELDEFIRERAEDRSWSDSILDRARIERTCTEFARRGDGADDHRLQYSLEWAFFTRTQWGEFDTAVYELERCWGNDPESPSPIGSGTRPRPERTIKSLDDVETAIRHYVQAIPYEQVVSTATTLSTDIDYRLVSDDPMAAALDRRRQAGPRERDIYASYIHEKFLALLEKRGDRIVFQFALGAEPLPFETGSRLSQRAIAQLGEMIARHPRLKFQAFLGSRHGNQSLCTLARQLPNLSLAGYWWHNFFPDVIRQIISERLDMLPVNKQIGFFSDSYCAEWSYAKAVIVRKQLSEALAQKVEQGQFSQPEALSIARSILYESPQTLLGMASEKEVESDETLSDA